MSGRLPPAFVTAGVLMPVMLGSGIGAELPDTWGTETRSERHTPSPGTTAVAFAPQFAGAQEPPRRTEVELEHARQLLGPAAEQLEQPPSHGWQLPLVPSKNCVLEQVGRQRPLESTGLLDGQLAH